MLCIKKIIVINNEHLIMIEKGLPVMILDFLYMAISEMWILEYIRVPRSFGVELPLVTRCIALTHNK